MNLLGELNVLGELVFCSIWVRSDDDRRTTGHAGAAHRGLPAEG